MLPKWQQSHHKKNHRCNGTKRKKEQKCPTRVAMEGSENPTVSFWVSMEKIKLGGNCKSSRAAVGRKKEDGQCRRLSKTTKLVGIRSNGKPKTGAPWLGTGRSPGER